MSAKDLPSESLTIINNDEQLHTVTYCNPKLTTVYFNRGKMPHYSRQKTSLLSDISPLT